MDFSSAKSNIRRSLYQPLNTQLDEIRLLAVQAGISNTLISCSLTAVPLGEYSRHDEGVYHWSTGTVMEAGWKPDTVVRSQVRWVPSYEALSYAWGDVVAKRSIEVNGLKVDVTANLFSALRTFRRTDGERVLWVDALCIDQDNIAERGEQVQRMQSIYQRATRTLVWLGDSDGHSARAMDLLERLGPSQRDLGRFDWPDDLLDWSGPHFDPCYGLTEFEEAFEGTLKTYISSLDLIDMNELTEVDWTALDKFLNGRSYWNRLWVVQEIANAQEVEVWCGRRSMGWDTFRYLPYNSKLFRPEGNLYDRFWKMFGNSGAYKIMNQRLSTRDATRRLGFERSDTSFLNLMETFRSFECTDPRDKVYALLSLTTIDKDMPLPTPDYSKSVSEVYNETVRAIISYTADLAVLCMSKSFQGTAEDRMPSWVPDWTVDTSSVPMIDADGNRPKFTAAGETLPQGPYLKFETQASGEQRAKRRPRKQENLARHLVNSELSKPFEGMIRRPIYHDSRPPNPEVLFLNGFILDSVALLGESIPESSFEDGRWKQSLTEWDKLLNLIWRCYGRWGDTVRELDPVLRHPKLGDFLLTLFRGVFFVKDHPVDDAEAFRKLKEMYVEHYLVWTGHISATESKEPISTDLLRIFDYELRDKVRGWKFSITRAGRMALVPDDAEKRDAIVIMFGADVPLVLRPIAKIKRGAADEILWIQIGAAYLENFMNGQALEEAEKRSLKTETFALM